MQFAEFLAEPFYRVATRAIVFDGNGNLLVVLNQDDQWEIPGGGWDHEETFDECLKREVHEELGVEVTKVNPIALSYKARDQSNYMSLRLAARTELSSTDFSFVPDDMKEAKFITREEADVLPFSPGEGVTQEILDSIYDLGS
ncbi:MAG: NUDIX hydrolase [Patescibacteria group bacterium]|nr:NUDIX hydrolase [Patescibacteria group bacterium]